MRDNTLKERYIKDAAALSITEIADKYGVSYASVWNVLSSAGIKAVKRRKQSYTFPKVDIDFEYTKSHTVTEIVNHYGITPYYARLLCKGNYKEKDHSVAERARLEAKGALRRYYYSKVAKDCCEEWKEDCCAFYKWAFDSDFKAGKMIGRKDKDKPYTPSNCFWE